MLKFADYKFNIRVKKSKLVNKETKTTLRLLFPVLRLVYGCVLVIFIPSARYGA